jgi:hypothetical protein
MKRSAPKLERASSIGKRPWQEKRIKMSERTIFTKDNDSDFEGGRENIYLISSNFMRIKKREKFRQ